MNLYKGERLEEAIKKVRPLIIEAINAPTAKICCVKTEEIYDELEDLLVELLQDAQKKLEEFEEFLESLSELPDFSSEGIAQGEGELGEGSVSVHFVPEEGGEGQEGEGSGRAGEGEEEGKTGEGDMKKEKVQKSWQAKEKQRRKPYLLWTSSTRM